MNEKLLERFAPLMRIVCCPRTKTDLRLVSLPELRQASSETGRKRIPDGTIGALVSAASSEAYPIIGPVVSFLEQDVVRLSEGKDPKPVGASTEASSIRQSVKKWYDEFGWKRKEGGVYGDTVAFSQLGQTAHGFYEIDSHLQFLDSFLGGEFLLDAGSGAIPHPEYLAYSWFYRFRVCVDISLTALQEAASNIGDRGFYIMADLCRLPFRDNAFDGIICGYTIQHVAESNQRQAVNELCRVLAPQNHCCIMTELRVGVAHRILSKVCRGFGKILGYGGETQQSGSRPSSSPPGKLYQSVQKLAWWRKTVSGLDCKGAMRVCRVFRKDEFDYLFGDSLAAAKRLRRLERRMPRLLAPFCRYVLVQLAKKNRP